MAQFLQIKHAKPYNGKDIANSNHSKILFVYKSGGGGCSGRQWKPQSVIMTACLELEV